jgi:hypothetical protein
MKIGSTSVVIGTLFLAVLVVPAAASASNTLDGTVTANANANANACYGYECGDIIVLEDFAGSQRKWKETNDPVMGGKSTGTFVVNEKHHYGVLHGRVEIVPFLNAPGFIKAETTAPTSHKWPDVSTCEGLQLVALSDTPSYRGFRISFGKTRPPGAFPYTYGYKADFSVTDDEDVTIVRLPFESFTDNWDAGTGNAKVTCQENKDYCPDAATKKDLYSIAIWGEGVEGDVDLQIGSIAAYGCKNNNNNNNNNNALPNQGDAEFGENEILIEDFSNPVHPWRTMNDPVMGGKSTSSLDIHDGMASFDGTCAIVPFLKAPGFVTMTTRVHSNPLVTTQATSLFPDVSSCDGLVVSARSRTDYDGYYISFGTDRVPGGHHASGYKTKLVVGNGSGSLCDDDDDDFQDVVLSFQDFSSHWDDKTGKTTVSCRDNASYCPSEKTLEDMETISVWGEGVAGTVLLDIRSIRAVGCSSSSSTVAGATTTLSDENLVLLDATTSTLHRNTNNDDPSFAVSGFVVVAFGVAAAALALLARRRFGSTNSNNPLEYEQIKQVVALDVEVV